MQLSFHELTIQAPDSVEVLVAGYVQRLGRLTGIRRYRGRAAVAKFILKRLSPHPLYPV
jgi:hypothetical protein